MTLITTLLFHLFFASSLILLIQPFNEIPEAEGASTIYKNSTIKVGRKSRQYGCMPSQNPQMAWWDQGGGYNAAPPTSPLRFRAPFEKTIKGNWGCSRFVGAYTACFTWCTIKKTKKTGWCYTKNKNHPHSYVYCPNYQFYYTKNTGKNEHDKYCNESWKCLSSCYDR